MNKFMQEAVKEAKKAYKKLEVPVGAVLVKDGVIIARGHNLRETKNNSLAHAELICINKACKKMGSWRLEDAEMYITLEPCAMCAGAIVQSRIKTIYIGAKDSKNGCVNSVCNLLEEKTTATTNFEYLLEDECSNLLSRFFRELREKKKNSI
ncbi:MAG: nucleoside deaminase [Clostridia bacterium]|nr:nucleoside deaminase [Clostridia bacterium]